MALPAPATRPQRGLHFLVNLGLFSLCYPLANLAAQRAHASRHVALAFAWVRSADDLRVLSRRMLLASVAASLVFLLYPLQFSVARPAVGPASKAGPSGYSSRLTLTAGNSNHHELICMRNWLPGRERVRSVTPSEAAPSTRYRIRLGKASGAAGSALKGWPYSASNSCRSSEYTTMSCATPFLVKAPRATPSRVKPHFSATFSDSAWPAITVICRRLK